MKMAGDKFTVCYAHVEHHKDKAPTLHGWTRQEFETEEEALSFAVYLKKNRQSGISVLSPEMAKEWNALGGS